MQANPKTSSGRATDQPPAILVGVVFALMTLFGIWPALTNGQPFFYADTTAYVRGADMAISKALGPRFATAWAKDERRVIAPVNSSESAGQGSDTKPTAAGDGKSNSRVIIAGRSIIYGALLYLGEVGGGMWLAVLVQSFVAVWLIFIFIRRTLGLSFRMFLIACLALLSISPLPFLVSNLMPDICAGFLIVAFTILATSWTRLNVVERGFTSVIILFAVLAHTTHLILLFVLTAILLAYKILRRTADAVTVRPIAAIATGCIILAFAWEAAFSLAVTRLMGAPPIRPPFVMAKLVSGLGPEAVAKVCATHEFAVCRFQDRFPIDNESFLWPEPYHAGVFSEADVPTKRALSDEQFRFALAIIPSNVESFLSALSRDAFSQLVHFNLDEYSYKPAGLNFFRERLPANEFQRMTGTWAARSDVYVVFGRTFLLAVTTLSTLATLLFLLGRFPSPFISTSQRATWRASTYIFLSGLILNAVICGGFSGINNRYQARVIWLMPLAFVTGVCLRIPQRKPALVHKPSLEEQSRRRRESTVPASLDKVVSISRQARDRHDSRAFFVE